MKVLIINGSPRKEGVTAKLLRTVQEGIGEGHEVEYVDISDLNIKPCIGCQKCRTEWTCALPEDDGHRIGAKIREAEALVMGTATYWGNMTGQLKVLFDRNVHNFIKLKPKEMPEQLHKGQPCVLAAACAAPWPMANMLGFGTKSALAAVKKAVGAGGYRIIGALEQAGTYESQEILPATLKKARKLGSRLVS